MSSVLDVTKFHFFKKLTELPSVEMIYLYGSRAAGNARERSDIDLAITCPLATIEEWLKIVDIVDAADTLLKIDLVRFDTLKSADPLRTAIIQNHRVLYTQDT